jgi:hypothetical protein
VIKSGIIKEQPIADDNGHLEHFSSNFEFAAKVPAVRFSSLLQITIAVWRASNSKKGAKWPLNSAADCYA